ncbi:MAG: hypothetical protein P8L31_10010 [Pseudomonadales bacterium]|jgi:hypothetical protein|nr:hypothetical protein [Pseudomonadales bacterium]
MTSSWDREKDQLNSYFEQLDNDSKSALLSEAERLLLLQKAQITEKHIEESGYFPNLRSGNTDYPDEEE